MVATTLTSSDVTTRNRRILELMMVIILIHSLMRKDGADDNDNIFRPRETDAAGYGEGMHDVTRWKR